MVASGGLSAPTINSFSIDTATKTVTFGFVDTCGIPGANIEAVDSALNVLYYTSISNTGFTCSYARTSSTPSPQFGLRAAYNNSIVTVK